MAKVITAQQAAELVKDKDVIAFAADGMVGFPTELVWAVRDRYLNEGHPRDITSYRTSGMGDFQDDEYGEGPWCEPGLLKRAINSYLSVCPRLANTIADNKIQGYMFPLGPLSQVLKSAARGMPGTLSKVGLSTFMDARYGGGKCNELTEQEGEDLVKYIPDFEGEEYLWYKSPGFNVAFLRGTTADINGNISCEKENTDPEILNTAQAVKSSGGIVIVQVERIAAVNEIHPRMVEVPGIYVDYIVVEQKPERVPQTMARFKREDYQPAFNGGAIISMKQNNETLPLNATKVMARRAAMEIPHGGLVNFGLGMPQNIPSVLNECGQSDRVKMISETGVIGGIPAQGRDFGSHYNPEAILDRAAHFCFFDGGNLDVGVFGLGEVDENGDMNTSHLNGSMTGIGGFTDISSCSKKVLFMGTFTAKGLKEEVKDGKLNILHEGQFNKFIKKCAKRSFVAEEYLKTHEDFLIITERCVIRCTRNGLVLDEVAPGIDYQTQVLDQCGLDIKIPEGGPKLMDPSIFTEDGFHLS